VRCTAIKNSLPDVQRDPPTTRLAINRICIQNFKVKVCLKNGDSQVECQLGTVTACVNLGEELRGIHVSRSVEAVLNLINGVTYLDLPDLQHILRKVTQYLLVKHEYSSKASVKLKLVHLFTSDDIDALPVNIYVSVGLSKVGGARYRVGVSFEGMSVCPCVQQVYSFLENTPISNTPSHSQRALILAHIDSSNPINLGLSETVKALLSAFSTPVRSLLKRDQEYRLVKKAFENPKFAEDVAREAVYILYKEFRNRLSTDSRITVKVLSFESVHPFNLCVKVRHGLRELDKVLNNGATK